MDLWVIHHFRVLPTDPKFLELSESQKSLLFHSFMELPSDEDLKQSYRKSQNQDISPDTEKNLAKAGYTVDQIAFFKDQIRKAYG